MYFLSILFAHVKNRNSSSRYRHRNNRALIRMTQNHRSHSRGGYHDCGHGHGHGHSHSHDSHRGIHSDCNRWNMCFP